MGFNSKRDDKKGQSPRSDIDKEIKNSKKDPNNSLYTLNINNNLKIDETMQKYKKNNFKSVLLLNKAKIIQLFEP